jgi:peptidoglycan/xylan/chitin deacetylase (PgdA/CDA1 family)
MYHSIADGVSAASAYFETRTAPEVFAKHVAWLCDRSGRIVSVRQGAQAIANGHAPANLVAVSFDDGYEDFYTKAFPLLRACGGAATVFVVAGCLGKKRGSFGGTSCLTTSELRELDKNGIEIGSHTLTHPDLRSLSFNKLEDEVRDSKAIIEDALGHSIVSFAYPYAFPEQDKSFTAGLRSLLKKHGYEYGVCTSIGRAGGDDDPYFLPRIPVNSWDDPQLFYAKLEGGYDWLRGPQRIYKRVKQQTVRSPSIA